MKIKKVVFVFTVAFFAFLGGASASTDAPEQYKNFKVNTSWLGDSKHSVYDECLLEDGRKFINNYEKIDNVIDVLSEYYNNFLIVTTGACDTKVHIYVFSDVKFPDNEFVYGFESSFGSGTTYELFTMHARSTNIEYKLISYDLSDLDSFDINDFGSKTFNNRTRFYRMFYSSNTQLYYYSSFDMNVTALDSSKPSSDRTFFLNDTEYTFSSVPLKVQSVYDILHPKMDVSYTFHSILNDDDIVEDIEVRFFPTVLDDKKYNYVYSVDGKNWTSVLIGNKSYFSFLTGENKKIYLKIFSTKKGEEVYSKTLNVPDLIGKTKEEVVSSEDFSNNVFIDGDTSSTSSDDGFSSSSNSISKVVSYIFPYFQFAFDFFDLIKSWSFNVEVDGDCFNIDSEGIVTHFSCTPLSDVSFDLSFLPYGVGEKIGTISVGRSFIMWFDSYREQLFFIEKLLMVTCVIVALLHYRVHK